MSKTRSLQVLLLLTILSVVLSACGGGGDDSSSSRATAPAADAVHGSGSRPSRDTGREGSGERKGSGSVGDTAASAERAPRSLATNPESISGAIVTSTGAVQTLVPDPADQREAMHNSYASIRSFGREASGSAATDITFALVQYLTAKEEGDWSTACARLFSYLRDNFEKSAGESKDASIEGGGCPAAYGALMKREPAPATAEAAKIDVASVRRGDDDRAFVIYKTPDTLSADMPMYLEDGVWTVGALEAYALTPDQVG